MYMYEFGNSLPSLYSSGALKYWDLCQTLSQAFLLLLGARTLYGLKLREGPEEQQLQVTNVKCGEIHLVVSHMTSEVEEPLTVDRMS